MNVPLNRERSHPDAGSPSLTPLRGAAVHRLDGALDCVSRKVRHLFDWWNAVAGGLPPDWSCFDVTEHRTVVAHLYLVKRRAPADWVFAIRGEAMHEVFPHCKATGPVAEICSPDSALALTSHYERVADTGRCHLVRGTILNDRKDLVDIESIDCPFIDRRAGRSVILGVIERIAIRPPAVA
ncbi:MAG: hypothetical protein ACFCVH_14600 [Alphaproteobacteria bacterium]